MNRFSNIVISIRSEDNYEVLIVSCQNSKGAMETVELFRDSNKYFNWLLSEIHEVRSNADKIIENFLHKENPEVMQFSYPHKHRRTFTIDEGIFPTKGRAHYDLRNNH